jgi:hypothetical protein
MAFCLRMMACYNMSLKWPWFYHYCEYHTVFEEIVIQFIKCEQPFGIIQKCDVLQKICLYISIICNLWPYALQPYRQIYFRGSVSDILSSYLLLPVIYFVSQLVCQLEPPLHGASLNSETFHARDVGASFV